MEKINGLYAVMLMAYPVVSFMVYWVWGSMLIERREKHPKQVTVKSWLLMIIGGIFWPVTFIFVIAIYCYAPRWRF